MLTRVRVVAPSIYVSAIRYVSIRIMHGIFVVPARIQHRPAAIALSILRSTVQHCPGQRSLVFFQQPYRCTKTHLPLNTKSYCLPTDRIFLGCLDCLDSVLADPLASFSATAQTSEVAETKYIQPWNVDKLFLFFARLYFPFAPLSRFDK